MKDVSIRAARLHQTRPLLCPEKASLYQEKSPRSWASGPAPGDSGAERGAGGPRPACVHRGWRGRASACAVGGRGSAPSTRCRLWWGPPPAPSHSGGSGRPPGNTQEDPLAPRGPHSPGRASLAAFPAGGTQARRPRTGEAGAGFGRTCLRQTQRDRPPSACGVSPVLAHVTSSRPQQPDTYAEAKLGGRPRGSLGHCGRVSYGASRRKAARTHRGLQLVGVADTPHFTSCGFPRSQHMTPAAEMRSH